MKKIVSLLVIVTIILTSFNINVHASTGSDALGVLSGVVNDFVQLATPTEQDTIQLWGHMLQASGLVGNIPQLGVDLTARVISAWATAIDADQANATTQDNIACIKEAVESMVDTSGGNVSISDSFKNAFLVSADYYQNQLKPYVYSFASVGDNLNAFANISQMQATLEMMEKYEGVANHKNGYWLIQRPGSGYHYLAFVNTDLHPYIVFRSTTSNNMVSGSLVEGAFYDGQTNNWFKTFDELYRWDRVDGVDQWVSQSNTLLNHGTCYCGSSPSDSIYDTANGSRQPVVVMNFQKSVPIRYFTWTGYTGISSILYQPYYYNNDVWQDFSTSSGDYTWSPSNINTVTYGDVTEYIDNSNTENGYPPSVSDINVYIEDKDDENKDTSSGGGSGSGGDDSGGGGGGIGSVGDIFGWLKQLGSVIASLIKGIGEFVTEVVTGLVAAITDLLGGIGDLITSITETLPTTFMNWFGTLFEWMPAEWKALLSASLVFMVLWGIIKLIRG